MKKTFFLAGIAFFLLTLTLNAQQPTQPQTQEQKKSTNPTVDSILSKYTLAPMPTPMTTEQIFPVIGQYQSTTNADQKLTVTLDEQNKGMVWIDGLPQGRAKGILKKSPGIYKIPVQKTADDKEIPEGTLVYDKDAKTISVMLGRDFNDADPASVFSAPAPTEEPMADEKTTVKKTKNAKTKMKVKKPEPWVFTGTKIEQVTAGN